MEKFNWIPSLEVIPVMDKNTGCCRKVEFTTYKPSYSFSFPRISTENFQVMQIQTSNMLMVMVVVAILLPIGI